MLRRHLADAHGLTTDEYRKRWNLRSDYPMVAPAYRERRSGLAKQFGLGRAGPKFTASDTASEPESARHRRRCAAHCDERARQSSRPRFLTLRTIGTEATLSKKCWLH